MSDGHCFISYSHADGLDFVIKLVTELEGGYPSIPVWFEKRDIHSDKDDWDDQLAKAIQQCKCLIYVMSQDSTAEHSNCKDEWAWALKYKKPLVCLWIDAKAEDQFRLNSRQKIDFTADFGAGLGKLRKAIAHLDSPEGQLEELNHRLADANRDLRRASDAEKARIDADIDELKKQIEAQEKVAENPEAAKKQTEQNIQNGLERERKPQLPVASFQSSKFINQPPGVAQTYFQDRLMETEQAILFLKNDAQRVLTVVGRGGAGKTAMTCRLLKFVENGGLPDDFERKHGRVEVDGIVYLSEAGSRKVNFANLFDDLCKLLPAASAEKLSALYREPQTSTESKTLQLLAAFQGLKQVIVLLDNFENVVDAENGQVKDAELDEALRAFLHAPHHPVKIIITTRVSARELDNFEPARQRPLHLDTGLQPEYAKEAFILMDDGNLVGIKNVGDELLNLAATRTRGLPRALEALYAALRTDRFTTLQELLDLPILPEQVMQAYVGEAFNRLDTNAQKVMQALAVYNRPATPAAVDYLLAPHLPAIDSAPILQRLANMHFARKESGRFYLHPVDREFAFGLIPEKDLTTKDTTLAPHASAGEVTKEEEKVSDVPDVSDVIKVKPDDVIPASETDEESLRKAKQAVDELKALFAEMKAKEANYQLPFTQHALTRRAADYFKKARKPRAEWKKLDDLSAQLAEFDLRCAAGDYDTAASVFIEIDGEYLGLWGHYNILIRGYEQVVEKIIDKDIARISTGNLGWILFCMGQMLKAVEKYEIALQMAKDSKNRQAEGTWLGNLGSGYLSLGNTQKAIESQEQALIIAREIGDRRGEAGRLGNLGIAYLSLGNAHKAIEFHEQALIIFHEINDRQHIGIILGNLGSAYATLGEARKAIEFYEKALDIDREIGDRQGKGIYLSNLANQYSGLAEYNKAIDYYTQALQNAREIGNKYGEGKRLNGLADVLIEKGDIQKAISHSQESIQIGREMSSPEICSGSGSSLAQAYLLQNDLVNARATIEAALQFDVPENNHNASALHGIIALRQGDEVAARGAFVRAIGQANEILSKTAEYYSALDAKGLALCGLALTKDLTGLTESRPDGKGSDGDLSGLVEQAIATFRQARKIAPHVGIVKRNLRLFDELAQCDPHGLLKDIRPVVAGED